MRDGILQRLGNQAAQVLFPPTCVGCGRIVALSSAVCGSCWGKVRFIEKPFCPVYGTPFSTDLGAGFLSAKAISDPPDFDHLRAAVIYDPLARSLVSGLKFQDRHHYASQMALWMARAGRDMLDDADLIVPVALHWRRFFARRFNQSALLARHLADHSKTRFAPEVLIRNKSTQHQIGLSTKDRAKNLRNAFTVPERFVPDVTGRNVVLIDDVYTTGATVNEAARALRKAKAAQIDVLTFAMVVGENNAL